MLAGEVSRSGSAHMPQRYRFVSLSGWMATESLPSKTGVASWICPRKNATVTMPSELPLSCMRPSSSRRPAAISSFIRKLMSSSKPLAVSSVTLPPSRLSISPSPSISTPFSAASVLLVGRKSSLTITSWMGPVLFAPQPPSQSYMHKILLSPGSQIPSLLHGEQSAAHTSSGSHTPSPHTDEAALPSHPATRHTAPASTKARIIRPGRVMSVLLVSRCFRRK